jgi:hypothetical protein
MQNSGVRTCDYQKRFDKIAGSDFELPQAGQQGEIQGSISYKIAGSSFELRSRPEGRGQDARVIPHGPPSSDVPVIT